MGTERDKVMGRGYKDPTIWAALRRIERDENMRLRKEAAALVVDVKELIRSRGFELTGRLKFVHRDSGRRYE